MSRVKTFETFILQSRCTFITVMTINDVVLYKLEIHCYHFFAPKQYIKVKLFHHVKEFLLKCSALCYHPCTTSIFAQSNIVQTEYVVMTPVVTLSL